VGALLAVSGLVIGLAGWRNRLTLEIGLLAVGNAIVLATVDLVYTLPGQIAPIYLLDAAVESALVALWLISLRFTPP
jgi:ABC-type cobalamin transport system permease subunit